MIARLGVLLGGALGFWLLLSYPAWRLFGEAHLVYSSVALALCAVPAAATLLVERLANSAPPETQLAALCGGMLVRMAAVLGGGLALSSLHSYFHAQAFWLWIAVFYLYTLVLEIGLIVQGRAATEHQPKQT